MSSHHQTRSAAFGRVAALVLLGCVFGVVGATDAICAGDMLVRQVDNVIHATVDNKPILEYQCQPHPYKVYVSKLYSPGGVQILRDSPHDHVHHHALMYAIGIDKIDFWAEFGPDQDGKQVARNTLCRTATHGAYGEATIAQTVDWIDPSHDVRVTEARRVTAHVGAAADVTLLTWESQFEPAGDRKSVEFWGRHYFGLGMRFVVPMDKGGTFINAAKAPGKVVRGTEKLARADWCAYTANVEGKPVTVAMFDAPDNPRHPATWFTMTSPFAYLSATLDLEKKTMLVESGKPVRLRYGVALWDGQVGADRVQQVYERWCALLNQ